MRGANQTLPESLNMKRTIFFLLFSLIAAVSTDCLAQKTYVVSVGMGDYKYPSIFAGRPHPVNDAKAVSHFFHDYNGSHVFMLLNENATKSNILRTLKNEFSKSTPNDEIIFVYSGHGVPGGLTSWETKDMNSIVSYNEIQNIMKNCKARRKIIIAMACYSGGLNKPGNSVTSQRRTRTEKTPVMLFTSSRPDESSMGSYDMKNSYFIHYVLKAFRGRADRNGDGRVTARELFNYVGKNVVGISNGQQHPQLWGNFEDDMVVVYTK